MKMVVWIAAGAAAGWCISIAVMYVWLAYWDGDSEWLVTR